MFDELPGYAVYLMDFRNIMIAEGLDRLTRDNTGKKVTVIYGAFHRKPVEKYARDPMLRKIKTPSYVEFNHELDPAMIKYEPTQDGWKKSVEKKL